MGMRDTEPADRFVFDLLMPAGAAALTIAWTSHALQTPDGASMPVLLAGAMAAVILARLFLVRGGRSFWVAALVALIACMLFTFDHAPIGDPAALRIQIALAVVGVVVLPLFALRKIAPGGACAAMALVMTYATMLRGDGVERIQGEDLAWAGYGFCLPFIALFARRGHTLEMLVCIAILLSWTIPGVRTMEASGVILAIVVAVAVIAQMFRGAFKRRKRKDATAPAAVAAPKPERALWLVFAGELALWALGAVAITLIVGPTIEWEIWPLLRTVLGVALLVHLSLLPASTRYRPVRWALCGVSFLAFALSLVSDPDIIASPHNVEATFWTCIAAIAACGAILLLRARQRGAPNFLKAVYAVVALFTLQTATTTVIAIAVMPPRMPALSAECEAAQTRVLAESAPYEDHAAYNRCLAEREAAMAEAAGIKRKAPLYPGGAWGAFAVMAATATVVLVLGAPTDKTWPPAWRGLAAPRQAVRVRRALRSGRRIAARFPVADSAAAITGVWLSLWRHLRGPNGPVVITEIAALWAVGIILMGAAGLPDVIGPAFGFSTAGLANPNPAGLPDFNPGRFIGNAIQGTVFATMLGMISGVRLMTYAGLFILIAAGVASLFLHDKAPLLLAAAIAFFACDALRILLQLLRRRSRTLSNSDMMEARP